jgi:hypothetical protein
MYCVGLVVEVPKVVAATGVGGSEGDFLRGWVYPLVGDVI